MAQGAMTERCYRSGVLRKTCKNRYCPNTSPSRYARHLPSRGGFGHITRKKEASHGYKTLYEAPF